MATKVFESTTITINGRDYEVKPLVIKKQRKAADILEGWTKNIQEQSEKFRKAQEKAEEARKNGEEVEEPEFPSEREQNDSFIDMLVEVAGFSIELEDGEDLVDLISTEELYHIIEVSCGWDFNISADDLMGKVEEVNGGI